MSNGSGKMKKTGRKGAKKMDSKPIRLRNTSAEVYGIGMETNACPAWEMRTGASATRIVAGVVIVQMVLTFEARTSSVRMAYMTGFL